MIATCTRVGSFVQASGVIGWTLWRGWIAGTARRRVRSLALITLAAGLAGGFSMLAMVAAERAETSWDRLREATRSQDLLVSVDNADGARSAAAALGAIDDVDSVAAVNISGMFAATAAGGSTAGLTLSGLDSQFGDEVYRAVVLEGRRPRSADEVLVNRTFLDRAELSVGDTFDMSIATGPEETTGPSGTVTIVGEQRGPLDETFSAGTPVVLGHPGLWERWGDDIETTGESTFGVMVNLHDGVDPEAFVRRDEVAAVVGDASEVVTSEAQKAIIEDAVRVQAGAFLVIAIVSAVVAAAAVSLLVSREVRVLVAEQRTVRALGADRPSVSVAVTLPFVAVGVVAAAVAVAAAVVASRWVPIGLPRRLEPAPGSWLAPGVLVVGGAIVAVTCAVAALFSGRSAQRPRAQHVVSRGFATTIAMWFGDRPAVGVGVAAADGGYDRAARGPARTTILAAIIATMLVTAAAVVHHIEHQVTVRPELAGYPYDLEVGGFDPAAWPQTMDVLDRSNDVSALTETLVGTVSLDGQVRQAAGYRAVRGSPQFTLLEGRLPESADEVAVGARSTLEIGSEHELAAASSRRVRVVGRAILDLGDGADSAEVLADRDTLEAIGIEPLLQVALVKLRSERVRRGPRRGDGRDPRQVRQPLHVWGRCGAALSPRPRRSPRR